MFKINKEYKVFLVFETKIGSSFLVAQFDVDVYKTFKCGHNFFFFLEVRCFIYIKIIFIHSFFERVAIEFYQLNWKGYKPAT